MSVVRYINRESSWLAFNQRVLAEATNPNNPLLEKIKFLSIFESNLDEFYMVRVSGLIEQETAGIQDLTPDGLNPAQQIALITARARELRQEAQRLWTDKLRPALAKQGIRVLEWSDLSANEQAHLSRHFMSEVFPICTPLQMAPANTFPFISNRSVNLAVELDDDGDRRLARVKIPTVVPRLTPVPGRRDAFILLESLIIAHLDRLFPGLKVIGAHLFRVIRDADVEIRELDASDLVTAIEQTLRMRRLGDPVLLEVQPSIGGDWLEELKSGLELDDSDVFQVEGVLGFDFLWDLAKIDRPKLKFAPHLPVMNEELNQSDSLFASIRKGAILVHQPYDSFKPVEAMVGSVANDPNVIGVKQTLYRVGAKSPIVEALLAGAEAGKQVAAMVELKARFDESNNLIWARALERAGVHVTYGFRQMKTHCKLCLVVRKEEDGIQSYAHIGTGNYNPVTSRLYTDLGLFTNDPAICQDLSELFNYLTGYSKQNQYRKLLVAPLDLRDRIIEHIEAEIKSHTTRRPGRIIFKLNSLVDPEVIDALYEASQAGVQIDLIVRGICCLRPGVKGLSQNIRVRSVVGRFLEHSRIYYFEHQGSPVCYIGSADMMRRNLDRRIEVLAPVESPPLIEYLRDTVLRLSLEDNQKAWQLLPNGEYRRVRPKAGQVKVNSQEALMHCPAGALPGSGGNA